MNLNRLRGEIVAKFRTQKEFAKVLGWPENKVSKLMTEKYKPDTDDIADIADALDLNTEGFCAIFMPKKSPNGDKKTA